MTTITYVPIVPDNSRSKGPLSHQIFDLIYAFANEVEDDCIAYDFVAESITKFSPSC